MSYYIDAPPDMEDQMIDFAFEPRQDDDSWSPDWHPDHPTLNGSDFCLQYFKADRRLIIHGADLSVRLLGEPVVDFALMLDYATRELMDQNSVSAEASLTQHLYSFLREEQVVTLTTTWPPGTVARLSWSELQELTERAKDEAVRLITTAHPELRHNTWLRQTVGQPPAA
ncbi:hypothetical protein [Streptomyces sp. NRRL S-340]|uniref:hypothetical protein n=1 Tax=Streptomyces sp. NRRL S-340 TaxID=1463901 RepID=UPI00131B041D|nr:hypothetical protein [Streptomyces sp. NRRL S-340]